MQRPPPGAPSRASLTSSIITNVDLEEYRFDAHQRVWYPDQIHLMERVAAALTASLARGLGVTAPTFSDLFIGGMSALRLLHYPLRPRRRSPAFRMTRAMSWTTAYGG